MISMGVIVAEIKVDCMGKNCPTPLVETRKALRKATIGDFIEITGDHPASKKEIPMAVSSLGQELVEIKDEGKNWKIRIKKVKE
jgi:tRNA 2-thiouridine synthesizing protein A